MKKFEIIFGILAAISIFYRFTFSTELNIILIFSMLGLSIFYTYLSFAYFNNIPLRTSFKRESYRGVSGIRILGTIALGIGLGLACLGIIWSILVWPFNNFYPVAIPLLLILGIIISWKFLSTQSVDYAKMLKRIFIIGVFAGFLWLIPETTLHEVLNIKLRE